MAAELSSRDQRRWTDQGIILIPPELGLQAIETLLAQGATQASVVPINWAKFLQQFSWGAEPPLYQELQRTAPPQPPAAPSSTLLQQLKDASPSKRRPLLASYIREQAVQVLGLDPSQPVDFKQPLSELGLDSLMAVEIRNALGIPLAQTLPVALLYDYPTIEALTDYLAHKIPAFELETPQPAEMPAVNGHVAKLQQASEAEVEALLLKELEALNF
jgi:acyl carrier protein